MAFLLNWLRACVRRSSAVVRSRSRSRTESKYFVGLGSVLLISVITYFTLPVDVLAVWKHWLQSSTALEYTALRNVDIKYDETSGRRKCEPLPNRQRSFKGALWSRADKDETVVLSLFDSGYVDMAFNLYETSFKPFNINNYLFIAADDTACDRLQRIYHDGKDQIECFTHFNDTDGATASEYRSKSFIRKSLLKTKLILQALEFGLKVLIVDLDIVFFRNPLPIVSVGTKQFDITIQSDFSTVNTGFYFVRPTPAAIQLHRTVLKMGETKNVMDQTAMDWVLRNMQHNNKSSILVRILNQDTFPCGKQYFELKKYFYSSNISKCVDCVIVHNNWISGKAAKVYRFREMGMWLYDFDVKSGTSAVDRVGCIKGGYYSNPLRKYLVYGNPRDFGSAKTLFHETAALKAAMFIGEILNRTVILPTFHCYGCVFGRRKSKTDCNTVNFCFDKKIRNCTAYASKHNILTKTASCTLNTFYEITAFDAQFAGMYREHVFLRHPKVPDSVKQSQSIVMLIESQLTSRSSRTRDIGDTFIFTPANLTLGASNTEIISWFEEYRDVSVLRFHSLYGAMSEHTIANGGLKKMLNKLNVGLKPGTYRQLHSPT